MDSVLSKMLQPRIEALKVLVVDDDQYMRKVVRTMLNAIGVKTVYEARRRHRRASKRSARSLPIS